MKSVRFVLPILLLLSSDVFAQHVHAAAVQPAVASEAQKSFETLKTLAGSWEGALTTEPRIPEIQGTKMTIMIRVTSRGNAVMHEMTMAGHPDNPITMLYLDGDNLSLTHYCDAGNRPRMLAKPSADGKSVAFEVVDVSGSTQHGNMADTAFTIIDADHHVEEWTYVTPGQPSMRARFDLHRTKGASGPFGR